MTDARTNVVSTLPDVMEKVKVDRQDLADPERHGQRPQGAASRAGGSDPDGLLAVAQTDDGKALLRTLYNINGLATAEDSEYDSVRSAAKVLNLNLEQELAPR